MKSMKQTWRDLKSPLGNSGDEADETEAHDKDGGRRDLESRCIIDVEMEHIRARFSASYRARSASGRTDDVTPTHPGGGSGRVVYGHDAWARDRGGGGCLCLIRGLSHEFE